MNTIVRVGSLMLDAILIRDANPRLAICQDRICKLSDDNVIIDSRDLLTIKWDEPTPLMAEMRYKVGGKSFNTQEEEELENLRHNRSNFYGGIENNFLEDAVNDMRDDEDLPY